MKVQLIFLGDDRAHDLAIHFLYFGKCRDWINHMMDSTERELCQVKHASPISGC